MECVHILLIFEVIWAIFTSLLISLSFVQQNVLLLLLPEFFNNCAICNNLQLFNVCPKSVSQPLISHFVKLYSLSKYFGNAFVIWKAIYQGSLILIHFFYSNRFPQELVALKILELVLKCMSKFSLEIFYQLLPLNYIYMVDTLGKHLSLAFISEINIFNYLQI